MESNPVRCVQGYLLYYPVPMGAELRLEISRSEMGEIIGLSVFLNLVGGKIGLCSKSPFPEGEIHMLYCL